MTAFSVVTLTTGRISPHEAQGAPVRVLVLLICGVSWYGMRGGSLRVGPGEEEGNGEEWGGRDCDQISGEVTTAIFLSTVSETHEIYHAHVGHSSHRSSSMCSPFNHTKFKKSDHIQRRDAVMTPRKHVFDVISAGQRSSLQNASTATTTAIFDKSQRKTKPIKQSLAVSGAGATRLRAGSPGLSIDQRRVCSQAKEQRPFWTLLVSNDTTWSPLRLPEDLLV